MEFELKHYDITYEELMALEPTPHKLPKKPSLFWRSLAWVLSYPAIKGVNFKMERLGMEKLGKDEPALIFMNHSNFLDFEIAMHALWPRRVNIVATFDAFINKAFALRGVGCIPTRKFTTDFNLIRDIKYCLSTLHTSVLMYPEADYSYGGRAHTIPQSAAGLIKMLGVPFCMLETYGGFINDPIYNNLHDRRSDVSATLRYVLSPEQIKEMSVEEIYEVLLREFSFDGFRWQREKGLVIDNPERAKDLHKILYKCPICGAEGRMEGKGTMLTCHACGKEWELDELGALRATDGKGIFDHIPDWYDWERECVRREILDGEYGFDVPAELYAMVNTKGLYHIGNGRILHGIEGMRITGCDGKLDFYKKSVSMYAVGAAFHWYKVGDGICIGDNSITYLAALREDTHLVMKARFASEEIYKILKNKE